MNPNDPDDAEKRRRVADGSWVQQWPGRPNTPEFWRLSDLVLQLDGASAEPGFDLTDVVPTDLTALQYMAEQRYGMFCQRLGLPENRMFKSMFIAAYMEAFTVGHNYHEKPPAQGWPTRTGEG
jgi:hypothetical protein